MGAGWCAVAASKPKIDDVELRIIGEADEDVVRFDITMNVATRMNVLDARYLHKLSAVNMVGKRGIGYTPVGWPTRERYSYRGGSQTHCEDA